MRFRRYIGIDYSGRGPHDKRTDALQIYESTPGAGAPNRVRTNQFVNWSRVLIRDRLLEFLSGSEDVVVGLDHAFGLPLAFQQAKGIASWPQLTAAVQAHFGADSIGEANRRSWRSSVTNAANVWRLTETWTSSARPTLAFQLRQGNVALSTHAGLIFLADLLAKLEKKGSRPFLWPIDGWRLPDSGSVVVEVYPALCNRRFEGAPRHPDKRDAWAVARWLQWLDEGDHWERYTTPPLSSDDRARARREGWILGVT